MKTKLFGLLSICFLLANVILYVPSVYSDTPMANTFAIERMEDFDGSFVSYGFSVHGINVETFDYFLLKNPSGETLADSTVDEFWPHADGSFSLFGGNFTDKPEIGNYTLERWYGDPSESEIFTLPYEVKDSDIPSSTPVILNPTPYTATIGSIVAFSWEEYPHDTNETVSYLVEVAGPGVEETQLVYDLTATFNLPPQVYIAHVFAWADRGVIINKGEDDEYRFVYRRSGVRNVQFEVAPIPESINIDIKPGSCPNPINVKSKGVLPVAILGTLEFDVTTIDPASIRLEGVAPIRSNVEDVSTPEVDSEDCECNTLGGDYFDDLTLKFKTQSIVEALGSVSDGDEVVLTLTGETLDGTSIEGKDCVIIKKKGKKKKKK